MTFNNSAKVYSITFDEVIFGDIMGKIVVIDGAVKDITKNSEGKVLISAEISSSEILKFTEWLSSLSNGKAEVKPQG